MRFRALLLLLTAVMLPLGCDSPTDTGSPVPTDLQLSESALVVDDGESAQLSASVLSEGGLAVDGIRVQWSSSDAAVATVDSTGLVEARHPGEARITAAAGALTAHADVTVLAVPTALEPAAGEAQTGTAGQALADSLEVQVLDRHGNPVAGVTVRFEITGGAGAVSPQAAETDAEGVARTAWTLGGEVGENTVEARVEGVAEALTFRASGEPRKTAESPVSSSGGTVETQSGTTVQVPAGALSAETTITIEPTEPEVEDEVVVPGTVFEFGPDGTQFEKPVAITIAYDPARLPVGVDARTLRLFTLENGAWKQVANSSVDLEARTVAGETTHFSIYAVRAMQGPALTIQGPDTVSSTMGRSAGLRFSVTATANGGVERITYALNGGAAQDVQIAAADSVTVQATVAGKLQEGENTVTFAAFDAAGERSEASFHVISTSAEQIGTTGVEIQSPAAGEVAWADTVAVTFGAAGDSIFLADLYRIGADGSSALLGREMFASGGNVPSQVEHTFKVPAGKLSTGENTLRVEVFGRNNIYLATGAANVSFSYDASADPCLNPTAVALGSSVDGSITGADCLSGNARYDYYTLQLDQPSTVALRASSGAFAPHIRMHGANGQVVALAYSEGDSAMFTRAVVPAGSYRFWVSNLMVPGSTGAYAVSVKSDEAWTEPCPNRANAFFSPGGVIAQTIRSGDCVDTAGEDPEMRYHAYYLSVTQAKTYRVTLTSDGPAWLSVWEGEEIREHRRTQQAGTVTATFTAPAHGARWVYPLARPGVGYQLSIEEVASDPCVASDAWTSGTAFSGTLTRADCQVSGRSIDYYRLSATTQLSLSLHMDTQAFTADVGVRDATGAAVINMFADSLNPGLTRAILAPGSYEVYATSVEQGATGGYNLWGEASDHDVDGCGGAFNVFVTGGVSTAGSITAGDCFDQYGSDLGDPDRNYDTYVVYARQGETLTVTVTGDAAMGASIWGRDAGGSFDLRQYGSADAAGTFEVSYTAETAGYLWVHPVAAVGTGYSIEFQGPGGT